jgi:hypothetical protein
MTLLTLLPLILVLALALFARMGGNNTKGNQ